MARRIDIIVNETDSGAALHRVLYSTGPFTRQESRDLLEMGAVWVDGRRVKKGGYRVASGQRIMVYVRVDKATTDRAITEVQPVIDESIAKPCIENPCIENPCFDKIQVLYLDGGICAINKPSGLSSMPTPSTDQNVVTTILARQLGMDALPIPIHRLDRDTTGVMVLALNRRSAAEYTKLQMAGAVVRCYTALAHGKTESARGKWDWPLARNPRRRDRWMVDMERGKPSETLYELGKSEGGVCGVYRYHLQLITGRTHQIRVHMSHAGIPIVGDPWYGRKEALLDENGVEHRVSGMCLHSTRYTIRERGVDIACEPSEPFLNLID